MVCRDPVIAVGAVGGVALAGVALVDWHYALKYVGVLGTQLTLINWITSYDSPQVHYLAKLLQLSKQLFYFLSRVQKHCHHASCLTVTST